MFDKLQTPTNHSKTNFHRVIMAAKYNRHAVINITFVQSFGKTAETKELFQFRFENSSGKHTAHSTRTQAKAHEKRCRNRREKQQIFEMAKLREINGNDYLRDKIITLEIIIFPFEVINIRKSFVRLFICFGWVVCFVFKSPLAYSLAAHSLRCVFVFCPFSTRQAISKFSFNVIKLSTYLFAWCLMMSVRCHRLALWVCVRFGVGGEG